MMNRRAIDPQLVTDSINALAEAPGDAEVRARMIVSCVVNHLRDDAVIIDLAARLISAMLPDGNEVRRWALECIGAGMMTPDVIPQAAAPIPDAPVLPSEQPSEPMPATVLSDVELVRTLGALGHDVIARMYAGFQEMTRRSSGSGWVDEHDALNTLIDWGMESSYANLRKYLGKGDGKLWDWNRERNRLYIYSPVRMTRHGLKGRLNVVQMALDAGRPELVITNAPGTKMMIVPFAGNMLTWHGNILAAWHNSRADHTQNISRFTLEQLWGVTKKTLITWERAVGISVVKCYAQYTDFEHIPVKHAFPYLAETEQDGEKQIVVRAKARHSNIYHAPSMKEHQHRRSPRERRRASKFVLEAATIPGNPNGACDAPAAPRRVGFIEPTGRRNFHANDGDMIKAFKRLKGHLKRHDTDLAPHFVRLGYDYERSHWVYEQSSGAGQQTTPDEQLSRAKADKWFAAHGGRAAIVQSWREMAG